MTKFEKIGTLLLSTATIQIVAMSNVSAQVDLMALLDTDQDGFISLKEAVGDAELLKNFGLIDTDEDGKISMDELTAANLNGGDDDTQ